MSIDNEEGPTTDKTTFIITDNSSQTARILPKEWIEPIVIIARIEGYDSIDEYVIDLVKTRLEMFTDTRDGLDENFQKYMHNLMIGKDVPNEWAPKPGFEDQEEEKDAEHVPPPHNDNEDSR